MSPKLKFLLRSAIKELRSTPYNHYGYAGALAGEIENELAAEEAAAAVTPQSTADLEYLLIAAWTGVVMTERPTVGDVRRAVKSVIPHIERWARGESLGMSGADGPKGSSYGVSARQQ